MTWKSTVRRAFAIGTMAALPAMGLALPAHATNTVNTNVVRGASASENFSAQGAPAGFAVFNGTSGNDTMSLSCSGGAVTFHGGSFPSGHVLSGTYTGIDIEGLAGNDDISLPLARTNCPSWLINAATPFYVDGGTGNDTIDGSDSNDILIGGTGEDSIYGNGGNDTISDVDGGFIRGGAGNDVININFPTVGTNGFDFTSIYGEAGTDTLNVNLGGHNAIREVIAPDQTDYAMSGNLTGLVVDQSTTENINAQNGSFVDGNAGSLNGTGNGSATKGYWLLGKDGTTYPFGDVGHCADSGATGLFAGANAVSMTADPAGDGYWILSDQGNVFACSAWLPFSSTTFSGMTSGEKFASISATPTGKGLWLFTNKGRVFTYGDASSKHAGNNPTGITDMSGTNLAGPIVASVATPSGQGYWMVGSDGGIFSFGDAVFYGSMGGKHLAKPVNGIVPFPSNTGYWLVAQDGGVFTFGTGSAFMGSMGGHSLNAPIVGMVPYGKGYVMAGSDGGAFDFSGTNGFYGSLGGNAPQPIVNLAAK